MRHITIFKLNTNSDDYNSTILYYYNRLRISSNYLNSVLPLPNGFIYFFRRCDTLIDIETFIKCFR